MPPKAARVSARTRVNAGRAVDVRRSTAPARPTYPVTPPRRRQTGSSARMASGYNRMAIRAAGTATRTGAAVRNQLVAPAVDRPWSCRTTRPATAAAQMVRPATRRRWAAADAREVLVSAVRMSAGLTTGEGLRYRQTAISGGPARATTSTAAAGFQPVARLAPGTIARTKATPAAAAGITAGTTPASSRSATWRLEAPRLRSMTSSSSRRATTIRAASRMTTTTITVRLTNSRSSTASTALWAVMKAFSVLVIGSLTARSGATVSICEYGESTAVARSFANAWAWSAVTPLTPTG